MKLGTKLLAAPLLTAVVVLAAGQINAELLSRAAKGNESSFRADFEHLRTLTGLQQQLGQVHASVYRTVALMASLDEAKVKTLRADLARQLESVQRTLAAAAGESRVDESLRVGVAQAARQIDKYRGQADQAIDLSSIDPNTGIAALRGADETYTALAQGLGSIVTRIDAMSIETVAASNRQSQRNTVLLSLAALLAAGAAVGVSWMMQRRLVAELKRAADVAREVATGDLAVDASSQRGDEVGDLMRALGQMQASLRGLVSQVHESSQSLQQVSSEVASSNLDLSQRTEQTASNLQQAASSMEQLTGTVRQSADSARQANQLAASAADVAQRGGTAVSQVVTTMDEINTASKKISDIVGVIDSIAFQTNILALNAAVEAARAGEQGRGFAVVAAEVRSLAGRSAAAAREIKGLIGTSVDKVEAGSRLVADAGSTMGEIVASVQRVTDVIGEITAAASEQSDGLGQVNIAMTQLDQMTQQNAALVEESAAAAESLKDQASRLAQVVGTFKLS